MLASGINQSSIHLHQHVAVDAVDQSIPNHGSQTVEWARAVSEFQVGWNVLSDNRNEFSDRAFAAIFATSSKMVSTSFYATDRLV